MNRSGRRAGPSHRLGAVVLAAALAALAFAVPLPGATATSYPPSSAPGRSFLSNLSAPSVTPGESGSVGFELTNPLNGTSIGPTVVTFAVYAFNGFPGDAVSAVPVANAPTLANSTSSGPVVNVTVGPLAPHASYHGEVALATSPDTPTGAFAIRTAVAYLLNGTAYRFESRGWFSASLWANATRTPNGSATVNLSMLNVSGIVPETAVLVRASTWPVVLGSLLAVGFALVGVGAFVYFRRGASSSSGAG